MSAPGWFPDSNDANVTRYWDGTRWTEERVWNGTAWSPRGVTGAAPAATPTPPAQAPIPTNSVPVVPSPQINIAMPTMSRTTWFLFSGALLTAIGAFLPWENVEFLGGVSVSANAPTKAPALVIFILLLLGGLVALAWPAGTKRLSPPRCIGMSIVIAVLWALPLIKLNAIANQPNSDFATDTPGAGWYLTALGLVLATIALFFAWTGRGSPRPVVAPEPA